MVRPPGATAMTATKKHDVVEVPLEKPEVACG
jgi:hypothetical protein